LIGSTGGGLRGRATIGSGAIGSKRGGRAWSPSPTLLLLIAVIAGAWAFSVWAELSGAALALHHHTLFHDVATRGLPLWAAVLQLAGAWQFMTAAMMLPSSLPVIRLYTITARPAPAWRQSVSLFLVAYFAVWTAFAVPAFIGDMGLHHLVHSWPWLDQHARLIPAATFTLAAVWQLTPLKDACLRECRHPAVFLQRYYARGPRAGLLLGLRHGIFCLGCCWALMMVMFAAGVAHLAWMGVLGLLMVAEKTLPGGHRLARPVGGVLAALAVAAIAVPIPGI
jgi:predicted metal-binding membrane protein